MTTAAPILKIKFLPYFIAMFFISALATAQPDPLLTDQKIHNFEILLSKAARGALDEAEFAKIKKLAEDAEISLKAGDPATADELYSRAREAYQAAVKSAQAQNHQARDQEAFAARMASTNALLKQLEEIGKGNNKEPAQTEHLRSLLAQAGASNDPVNALAIANRAYYMTQILLKNASNGKNLTVDHVFATPALKYADELAYNDAHLKLLDSIFTKGGAEYSNNVSNAKVLREKAEREAEQKDYGSAIRDLVLSTRELLRVLERIGLPALVSPYLAWACWLGDQVPTNILCIHDRAQIQQVATENPDDELEAAVLDQIYKKILEEKTEGLEAFTQEHYDDLRKGEIWIIPVWGTPYKESWDENRPQRLVAVGLCNKDIPCKIKLYRPKH